MSAADVIVPVNLGALIDRGAHADQDAVALIELDDADCAVSWRFVDLDALADRVAHALIAHGLLRGDRVAVLAANSAHYVATLLGIMRAGLVAVPVNFRFPRALSNAVIEDSGARVVFCDAKRVAALPDALPAVVFDEGSAQAYPSQVETFASFVSKSATHDEPFVPLEPEPDETGLMLYTSGSTGKPKGVLLSHRSHLWVVQTRLAAQPLQQERVLIAAPLFHMNALALMFLSLAARATVVLLPQFDAAQYIRAIDTYRCSYLTAVPPMIAMMLQQRDLLAARDLSSVRYVRMGSAPVSGALLDQIHALLPNARVINAYGTTEGGPVVFAPLHDGVATPSRSVGVAHPLVALRLVDEDGNEAAQGELQMKSPGLMTGYHNRPDVRKPFTEDGFYRSGDVFERDAQGFYTFVGRRDDMFVSGGENIYPGDVERMLERHPAIVQASVVPVDDAIKGTKPVAFVIVRAGASLSEAEVKAFALEEAPAFQHPRHVWFVDALPLAATNKIDRAALKADAAQRLAARAAREES